MTAVSLPKRSRKNTTTLAAMIASTSGVGLVEPTAPVRPGPVLVKAGTWRERFAPTAVQSGHCQPTGADTMHSVQMGRSHRPQRTLAARSGWRAHAGAAAGV